MYGLKPKKTGIGTSQLVCVLLNLHASAARTWALETLAGSYRDKHTHG